MRDKRAGLDPRDRLADIDVGVTERLGGPAGLDARFRLDAGLEVVIGEGEHAAVGVVNQDDLARAEQALADRQGPDLVIGDHAARVADHVCVALGQAENAVDVQPGVHASHHGHVLGRRQRQLAAEGACIPLVVREQFVSDRHDAGSPWSRQAVPARTILCNSY